MHEAAVLGSWPPDRSRPRRCQASYLIGKYLGPRAEAAFFRSLTSQDIRLEPLAPTDLLRGAELVERYAELGLGGTDAWVAATAERLGLTCVATGDTSAWSVPGTSSAPGSAPHPEYRNRRGSGRGQRPRCLVAALLAHRLTGSGERFRGTVVERSERS
ncbi:MAG: PIN domain-containing protein [Egibacteraceae bacterium]